MRDKILNALNKVHRALTYEEIDSLVDNKTIEETKEMSDMLNEMIEEGDIYAFF